MINAADIAGRVKKAGKKRVLVQVPEGLKTGALELMEELEEQGIRAFLSVETCYGACDPRDHEARLLGCDLLLHIGHSGLGIKTEVPVLYYEYPIEIDPVPVLKKNLDALKPFRRIGLVTTVQHLECLPKAREFLEKKGKKAIVKGNGQVLGCMHTNLPKEADCILFIGSGRFHPLGILSATGRPVLFLDIEKGSLQDLTPEREKERMRSMLRVEKARSLERFGILVSTKKGQLHPEEASKIKESLENKGKRAFLLAAGEFTPQKILGLDLDCLVDMACPRLADDSSLFKKPTLTREEAEQL